MTSPDLRILLRLLDADDDPFGVADWWLGRNAWLEGVPADLIGCPHLGRIAPGAAGDLVWLGPGLQARATWIGGRQVFGATAPVG